MAHFADQGSYSIRCEWGLEGLAAIGSDADVIIVVDVLSYSTTVDVAVSRGAMVLPCRWKDERAEEYARENAAKLAGARAEGGFSLSPVSMLKAQRGDRIVLPSPNGATISFAAAEMGKTVLCGGIRNARAVAQYAVELGSRIALVPAGERWADGSLRPAIEDLAGAGAIIAHLAGDRSPEAAAAAAVWNGMKQDLVAAMRQCASGRQLIEEGYEQDVLMACEQDCSIAVPILRGGAYVSAIAAHR